MSRAHRALQPVSAQSEQPQGHRHRIYTVAQLLGPELLNMPRSTFFRLRGLGKLPFLVEIEPRAGRVIRYRADLVDRYLDGQWGRSRFFNSHAQQSRSADPYSSMTLKAIGRKGARA